MASVDDRVVSIKFDNDSFQRKIAETISSLDKLKASMDFSGPKRGLEEMKAAGNNFNMHGVTSAIEGVSAKFTAMSAIALTALATITSKAVMAGAQIAQAFTIAPVIQGFKEYETQLNSVQTILANTASKGTTLDQVNDALQKLNEYSDQTIYNFGEMARNIGTFTAAGVDLDTSVQSIKGIANLAAMSGSNSEQAATAMYQLSQAISAGSVKLMDWNSVVNAGMGGEAFKSALFETGKAMGTITGVPVDQTFTQWEDAGNSFRESLEKGWITADVLTTTLAGFTGDLTKEMLLQKGFTDQQADNILKTAAIAKAAATEVKTFTQLVGTIKEAVGTGWADSFKTIVGNFEEAKGLWTMINNTMGGIIKRSSDVRNMLLGAWKAEGGRAQLVEALINAFQGLKSIIDPIKAAFRDIFPPVTVQTLLKMSTAILEFSKRIAITGETASKIRSIFGGFFAILNMGWTILKGVINVIKSFVGALAPAGNGLLTAGAAAGDFLVALNNAMVKGGKFLSFFEMLSKHAADVGKYIIDLKDKIVDFFTFDIGTGPVATGMEKVSEESKGLSGFVDALSATWDRFTQRLSTVGGLLGKVSDAFKTLASGIGTAFADAFGEADFNKGIDVLNVGILAAIGAALWRIKNAIKNFDPTGGFMEKANAILDETRKTLKTFQLEIKAQALLKIAAAMAILTASIVVLSLIDSVALTKSLTAMTVGFGQMVATMALLNKMSGETPKDAAKLVILAGAMLIIAAAMAILSMAIQNLSDLDMGELAIGLIGVSVGLQVLVQASKSITKDKKDLAGAGAALISISLGLLILSAAVTAFAYMNWSEMAQGLIGLGIGLGMMTIALNKMPKNMSFMQKAGFGAVALGLRILAEVVLMFGNMDWQVMFQGLLGLALAMGVMTNALNNMPKNMQQIGVQVLLVSAAMYILAQAMKVMGSIELGEMAKGIIAFTLVLLVLSAAMEAMQGGTAGAGAMILVAGAMMILSKVIKEIGEMDLAVLIQGLLGLVLVIGVLAGAAAALSATGLIPAMIGLGIALSAVGVGITLLGVGALAFGKAFELMAKYGVDGARAMVESFGILMGIIPQLAAAFALFFVNVGLEMVSSLPQIIGVVEKILNSLLDLVIKMTPKIAQALVGIIDAGFLLIREGASQYIETGLHILMELLRGIRDNIGEVVTLVGEIITSFIDALTEQIPRIAESVVNFVITLATEVAYQAGRMQTAFIPIGIAFMDGFLAGLTAGVGQIITFFTELPGRIIDIFKNLLGIASPSTVFLGFGIDIITGLLNGLWSMIGAVWSFFSELGGKVISWVGNAIGWLWEKGKDIIMGLINGIGAIEWMVINWFKELGGKVIGWIGDALGWLVGKGTDILTGLLNGIKNGLSALTYWLFWDLPKAIWDSIVDAGSWLLDIGKKIIEGLWNGMKEMWGKAAEWVGGLAGAIVSIKGPPKKDKVLLVNNGMLIMQGLQRGMENEWANVADWLGKVDPSAAMDQNMGSKMAEIINNAINNIESMGEFNPVITPVLDLTKVEAESAKLQEYMRLAPITPEISLDVARIVSANIPQREAPTPAYAGPTEVTFEQNIYSPTQLSTNDIYRNTKSQIVLAKEALGIK